MTLGELETQVLNFLWTHGEADAKQVHASLSTANERSLNTVQSTLDRLYKKALLKRVKSGHAFRYWTALTREELIARQIRDVTGNLLEPGQDPRMAAFLSLSSGLSASELDQLESLIDTLRNTDDGAAK